jgi:6-phosphogluconolactonase
MIRGVQDPVFLTVHPNGRYLYTANASQAGTVSAFEIDPATGKLTQLNTQPSAGGLPVYITVDKTGKNLLEASDGGAVAVLAIDASGHLRQTTSVIRRKPEPADTRLSIPHSINLSPDNRFAIVTDFARDEVAVYKFDAARGALTPNDPPYIKIPADGPRHFRFHPNGIFAYAIEEQSRVTAMRWDAQRGVLTLIQTISTLPADFHGNSIGAEMLVHPGGRFLYGSNRGHDSIAVFTIDQATGALTPVQYASTRGKRPSNFQIDPAGNYIFAGNLNSNNVVQFRIDQQTGFLTPTGVSFNVVAPAGMTFVAAR